MYSEIEVDTAWQTPADQRADWALARTRLEQLLGGGEIIDVGCNDGRFLGSLDGSWQRYGIELNRAAVERAAACGITILGHNVEVLDSFEGRFDVITAFDVIEHVENPAKFLAMCARALRSRGIIVVATGNSHSFPWRLLGSRTYYCVYPEHLVFVSPDWCVRMAPRLGLVLESIETYRRLDGSWYNCVLHAAKNIGYRLSPSSFALLRRFGFGGIHDPIEIALQHPPTWPTARDHFLAVFEKAH